MAHASIEGPAVSTTRRLTVKNARIAVWTTDPPFISDPYATCPICGGMGTLLGILGLRQWWRCRDCGVDFSRETR
jgi:hypothetical protein